MKYHCEMKPTLSIMNHTVVYDGRGVIYQNCDKLGSLAVILGRDKSRLVVTKGSGHKSSLMIVDGAMLGHCRLFLLNAGLKQMLL